MEPSAGILLIADPFLKDPNFMRTVVFVLEHQSEGTFGFVLNRSYEYTLDQLVSEADGMKIPVFLRWPRTGRYHPFPASVSRSDTWQLQGD